MKWLEYIGLAIIGVIFLFGLFVLVFCLLDTWWRNGFKDNDD